MLWKYLLFEGKVLLKNRKQWLIGLFLVLLFPLYFQFYLDSEPETLDSKKIEEKEIQDTILNVLPPDLRDTSEGNEIYDNLTDQLSLINMQITYLTSDWGKRNDNYVEDGLLLNELRLELHEKGNPYIQESLVKPKEEIEKENAFLHYLHDRDMDTENNPFVSTQFIIVVIGFLSGLLLYICVLIIGSDMLVYEKGHQTVLQGLPISFTTKAISKVSLLYVFIMGTLGIGAGLGIYRSFKSEGFGTLSYPVLVYTENGFEAISTMKYIGYVFLAILVIVCMVLCLSLLLNIIFQHMYATVLIGLGLFALPDLLHLIGIHAKFLYPLKYIDITAVLSGQVAEHFGKGYIDYWHSIIWMAVFMLIMIVIILLQHRFSYLRKGN